MCIAVGFLVELQAVRLKLLGLRSPYGMNRPSVSASVTLLRPTQRVKLFGNIVAPSRDLDSLCYFRYA